MTASETKTARPLDGWRVLVPRGGPWGDGVAASLKRSRLVRRKDMLRLEFEKGDEMLYGEAVERRFKALAGAMDCSAETGRVTGTTTRR